MASQWKGVFYYRQFAQGWTESWFTTIGTLEQAIIIFKAAGALLVNFRSFETVLEGLRVSADPPYPLKSSARVRLNYAGTRGQPAGIIGALNPEDVVATSALTTFEFANSQDKTYLLRGLGDDDVLRGPDGQGTPKAELLKPIEALGAGLQAIGIAGRRQDQSQHKIRVSAVGVGAGSGTTQLIGPNATSFAIGDKVHFLGVPKNVLPWLTGIWDVVNADGTSITIQYPFGLAGPVTPLSMKAQKVAYLYPIVQASFFEDFRSRKTGRPFSPTRGRASGIRFRRLARVGG